MAQVLSDQASITLSGPWPLAPCFQDLEASPCVLLQAHKMCQGAVAGVAATGAAEGSAHKMHRRPEDGRKRRATARRRVGQRRGLQPEQLPLLPSPTQAWGPEAAREAQSLQHSSQEACVLSVKATAVEEREPSPCPRKSRHVRFDMDACTTHEIPPYAEIYGLHPREFVFGRGFHLIPMMFPWQFSPDSIDCEDSGDENSSDEED
uniref:Uncharacterized protein n=1 Tax=Alexandrium andersonii TaxID=327968 RepID=A0A7S2FDT8_9DINO